MNKNALLLFFILVYQIGLSQNKAAWKGYFSYSEIKNFSTSSEKLFVASENALFSQNVTTGEIKTTNTIDGLSGQTITALYHSENFKKTLVGYENGLLIVINETDGTMLKVIDIINKAIPPNIKKINHFMEYNGVVYVSCDFGIVQYNLATLQFGDTYFIGSNGAQTSVKETAVLNNTIYATTANSGIKSASITNTNLNDFNQWGTLDSRVWQGIAVFNDQLYAVLTSGALYILQGNALNYSTTISETPVDMRTGGAYLIVTSANHVYLYNSNLAQVAAVTSNQISEVTSAFKCATVINQTLFIGTEENGVFSKELTASNFENSTPDGPLKNSIFSIEASTSNLWAVFGGYSASYNPFDYNNIGTVSSYGISKFNEGKWLNIPYKFIKESVGQDVNAMVRITVNPSANSQVYISSYHSGLLKMNADVPAQLFDETNSGLEALSGTNFVRINGTAFDKSGNLWATNARVAKGLKVLKTNNQWQSYNMESVYRAVNGFEIGKLVVDKNGTKWIGTRDDGVIGFNEGYNNRFKTLRETSDTGNLPINDVKALAVDNRNQLWIGTRKGLRVLYSVDSFLSAGQLNSESIIILEDNLAQELLYEQAINDIVVDGSNNKWIGTSDSGVFLVSPNGQKTIYHFTINNSPLPSNNINDIDINGSTGEVFIATTKGMISFKGTATDASENLENVYVYPNPVRPEYEGTVKISGLLDKANVKVADIEGNLVFEATAEGGTIEWDTTAFGKYKVASGVYMVFISSQDGAETKVKKIMIVR